MTNNKILNTILISLGILGNNTAIISHFTALPFILAEENLENNKFY